MGLVPPPPPPDPRLTPQKIHGNIPPLDRRELPLVPLEQRLSHAHQVQLARLLKHHRQQEQDLETAYNRKLDQIATEFHPRPMDTSTHDPDRIVRVFDARRVDYWGWNLSWRLYAFIWIIIDIAMVGFALYSGLMPKF